MAQTTIDSDLYVNGHIASKTMTPPAGSVTNNSVIAAAGIEATKLEHQFEPVYSQEAATVAAADNKVMHVVRGATGDVIQFAAGSVVVAVGDSTATIDLQKNGVSILTAAIVLDNANAVRTLEAAAGYSATTLAAGDVLSVVVTVTPGTGTLPKGLFVRLTVREDAT